MTTVTTSSRTRRLTSLVVIMLAATWSLWPISPRVPTQNEQAGTEPADQPDAPAPARGAVLDVVAFHTPIWVAPPAPPSPPSAPAPVPPPPPIRLQLLAIIKNGGGDEHPDIYAAMLYDPDADKVLVLSEGDGVGGRTVGRIDASSVQLLEPGGSGRGTATVATLLVKANTAGIRAGSTAASGGNP